MKTLHVNLRVGELRESVRFYSTLFDAEPTVIKPDYAKWMLDDPRVNFALVAAPADANGYGVEHLGIQVETEDELAELRRRISGIGGIGGSAGRVFDEGETVCCYHASDKTWVKDAQDVSWEVFYTSGEADVLQVPVATTGCGEAGCCT